MKNERKTILAVIIVCILAIVTFSQSAADIPVAPTDADWIAYPMHIAPLAGYSTPHGYSPNQIRAAYNLPSSGGAGTTIAIIDAYDTPTIWNDLTVFSRQFNLPLPTESNFRVYKMDPNVGTDSNWAQETCLDVEWAHAIAPDASILLVEARDASSSGLYAAINYATSQPGVVAVSMSWGGTEFSTQRNRDAYFNKPGIVFFASAGDNGAQALYPASSPYVVAVGGTKLSLAADGSVISETGWSGSGGGVSAYEPIPSYQSDYGLTTSRRAVPDVSYNADPSSGVSVYSNGSWYTIGGTSAGAPQWAAIHAMGLSATNYNLYQKAKSAYPSYFRDITSGSNGYSATSGYDYVTGLGSPLAFKFATGIEVTPSSGPAGAPITLSGTGFTEGGSVTITYLNPITNSWVPIISNMPTAFANFSYTLNAPDLSQSNPPGDHPVAYDKVVFRVQDDSNNRTYNSTTPYTEYRRGLSQIYSTTATGLIGNNTNLANAVFVQNGQSIPIAGSNFVPGTASLSWDDTTSLGTSTIDGVGSFTASIQVPDTSAGQHKITINDGASNFNIQITRLPAVITNKTDTWQTQDTTINLTPDYPVNETYYSINNGSIRAVSINGLPVINTEGNNNTLEYWSQWDVYGTGAMNLTHTFLQGIALDKNPPEGTITTTSSSTSNLVTLNLSATDAGSGVSQMAFSNDGLTWSSWEPYATIKIWNLAGANGQKTVAVKFMDNAGLTSIASYIVTLAVPEPSPSPTITPTTVPTPVSTPTSPPASTIQPSPAQTQKPTLAPTVTSTPTELPSEINSPATKITDTQDIPLFSLVIALLIAALTAVALFVVAKMRR